MELVHSHKEMQTLSSSEDVFMSTYIHKEELDSLVQPKICVFSLMILLSALVSQIISVSLVAHSIGENKDLVSNVEIVMTHLGVQTQAKHMEPLCHQTE
ncbi:hypothetical protein TVAG_349560 [Trichomonas vaginalis G3]|uniref:Uncharacterized protein n=1 Tax=Trichomonas vaginalis (strain ATCC PRA-98 / G3) TaxID=412133 RepID=A2EMN3_TRIV3|nr:hypothetical protein TVAGG3_0810310 [Trichomonas vaginalis G3]EAY06103.1 hypothetical protein TVAG_349560 [Trichomonas vaginalis G3]KAI5497155.1 hypothetical protein TVAGG3_0810310 [Trichomonas vaginalis G3]|eukprot:XP_001318326.1 hypothetical protein [Trichomonas vaginalis G3]